MTDGMTFAVELLSLAISFALGAIIKYVDDCHDECWYGGRWLLSGTVVAALLSAASILISASGALFLTAVAIGCLLGGKVDNWHFAFLSIVVLAMYSARVASHFGPALESVLLWGGVAFADTVLSEVPRRFLDRWWGKILDRKPLMPLLALVWSIVIAAPPVFMLQVLLFDGGYALTRRSRNWIRMEDPA